MYPKVAKYSVWGLFLLFLLAAGITIIAGRIPGCVDANVKNSVGILMTLLLIPSIVTLKYFLDPVGNTEREVGFVEDSALTLRISPLLVGGQKVRVGYYDSHEINAFAISSISGSNSIIAFSTQLIARANPAQFLAIAAHEIAHLKNKDSSNKAYILAFNEAWSSYPRLFAEIGKNVVVVFIPIIIFAIAVVVATFVFFNGVDGISKLLIPLLHLTSVFAWPVMAILGYFLLNYLLNSLYCRYSREREFMADAEGAAMTSRYDMKSALTLLTDPGTSVRVFDTHPPLKERLARLQRG